MKSYYKSIGKAAVVCFLISLFMLLGSGCGISIVTQNSSILTLEETSEQNSEADLHDLSESEESGIISLEDSKMESMPQGVSQDEEYSSILDFIPASEKHFLQKKDRVTEKEESSEEESSEEESQETDDSQEESQTEITDESRDDTFSTKYLIRINKSTNVVTVYVQDKDGKHSIPIKSMLCSTGTMTPSGTFMMGYQSRWKGLVGGQWAQCVSHIAGDYLIQSVPYQKKSSDSILVSSYNALGTTATNGSVYLTTADAYWIYMNCMAYNTVIQIGLFGNSDPLGKPSVIRLPASQKLNWDPSDPADGNPWNTKMPYFTGVRDYTIYVGESTPDLLKNVHGYDTCGNEQTGLIRVSGSVNGYVPGTYTVTYYLTDVLGRTGVQHAYITVKAKNNNSYPESSRPESSRPESSRPESSRPESSRPESSRPESSRPESSLPESSRPESSVPESSRPESSVPESSTPENSKPDYSEEESSEPEDSIADSSYAESSISDDMEEQSKPKESSEESSTSDQVRNEGFEEESRGKDIITEESSSSESISSANNETENSQIEDTDLSENEASSSKEQG